MTDPIDKDNELIKLRKEVKRLKKIELAAQNLVKVKGRYHAELAYEYLEKVLKED